MARKYELKQRAEQVEETRQRIVEATSALHLERGPAATSIAEIARRAGVQRRTVYNHFPDDSTLFEACSAHWGALHPPPDPAGWTDLRQGLQELYAWYRETERMTANVLRDAEILPSLRAVMEPGFGAYMEAVRDVLAGAVGRSRRVDAAIRLVTDFHSWRSLAPLGDEEAVELSAGLVELAGARRSRPRGTRARRARS
jgi:AcrR family transcriptional regulator